MTGRERQYHLRFWPEEDRMSLSVDVDDGRELRFMVTRRVVKALIGLLADILGSRSVPKGLKGNDNPERRNECLRFAHEAALSRNRASQPGTEGGGGTGGGPAPAREPAGPPILINRVDVRGRPNGEIAVQLSREDQMLTLNFSIDGLHVFVDAVLRVIEHAQWDIVLTQRWLHPGSTVPTSVSGTVFH